MSCAELSVVMLAKMQAEEDVHNRNEQWEKEKEKERRYVHALLGNDPSDAGVILSLVLAQLTTRKPAVGPASARNNKNHTKPKARDWIVASTVCRSWAQACEASIFKPVCLKNAWRIPRRPRSFTQIVGTSYPWRAVYL